MRCAQTCRSLHVAELRSFRRRLIATPSLGELSAVVRRKTRSHGAAGEAQRDEDVQWEATDLLPFVVSYEINRDITRSARQRNDGGSVKKMITTLLEQ